MVGRGALKTKSPILRGSAAVYGGRGVRMVLFLSPTLQESEDNLIKLYELNLGVFLGALFEIRTFSVICNPLFLI